METNKFASARAQSMPNSVFAVMDDAKAEAADKGLEIIDLSLGSSDLNPPKEAIEELKKAVADKSTYGYCLHSCTRAFRQEAAAWYERKFDTKINPKKEVLPLIGSQEGLANLLLATTDPNDTILIPDPGYPAYFGAVVVAGLKVEYMPLLQENGFLPEFDKIDSKIAKKAKLMIISYPNNPTAAVADNKFMQTAVSFCHDNNILLVHDFPYVDMVFGNYKAPSILSQKGGLEIGIELFSSSKSFHMGGFRMAWAIGNSDAIAALKQIKSAIDFNQYLGIQKAVIAAMKSPQEKTIADAHVYQDRRDLLVDMLNDSLWQIEKPKASMYIWAKLPKGLNNSVDFAVNLAKTTGVSLAPGRGFGQRGEGYVRFALVREPEVLKRAVDKINEFLD